jgi:prophage regulatory protein
MTIKFLRKPDVLARRGTSRPVLYRHIALGLFPKPVKIGTRSSAWPEDEVDAVQLAQLGGATPDQIKALVTQLHRQRCERASELIKSIPAA